MSLVSHASQSICARPYHNTRALCLRAVKWVLIDVERGAPVCLSAARCLRTALVQCSVSTDPGQLRSARSEPPAHGRDTRQHKTNLEPTNRGLPGSRAWQWKWTTAAVLSSIHNYCAAGIRLQQARVTIHVTIRQQESGSTAVGITARERRLPFKPPAASRPGFSTSSTETGMSS